MKSLNFAYLVLVFALVNVVRSEFIYSCKKSKTIALTFDDGPFKYTKELVDYIVDNTDAKVTFFHVGRFHYPYAIDTKEYQRAMKKAHDNGLQIASHTYEHKISSVKEEFKSALDKMDNFIEEVTGDKPRYFRAPKGHCDSQCQASLDEWGYKLIQWDVDTNDWDLETSGSAQQRVEDSINILKKKFAQEKDSYLILMHDSQEYTVRQIAPWIIEKSGMKEKGYRFVSVAECLGDKEGMYRSGETYGSSRKLNTTIAGNATTTTTTTTTVATTTQVQLPTQTPNIIKDNASQSLTSGAFANKPMMVITYLALAVMSLVFLSM